MSTARNHQSNADRYRARRAQGLCGQCGKAPRPGRATCQSCATKAGERSLTWQHQQHARGLCKNDAKPCDTNPRTGLPYVQCRACRLKESSQDASRYAERVAAGLCVRCGAVATNRLCPSCSAKQVAHQRRIDYRGHAQGLCQECGKPAGTNAKTSRPFWRCRLCRVKDSQWRAA